MLEEFFRKIVTLSPHILVTFNGDFFDFPFVEKRGEILGVNMEEKTGLKKQFNDDFYLGKHMLHLDAFNWVQRDSYLPQGARGLKAVTRYTGLCVACDCRGRLAKFCKNKWQHFRGLALNRITADFCK